MRAAERGLVSPRLNQTNSMLNEINSVLDEMNSMLVDGVRGMVLKQVGRMTLIGGAIGIIAALGLGRAASSLLFGMEGHDPLVIGLVAALLGGVALGAGYLPALRASRPHPRIEKPPHR